MSSRWPRPNPALLATGRQRGGRATGRRDRRRRPVPAAAGRAATRLGGLAVLTDAPCVDPPAAPDGLWCGPAMIPTAMTPAAMTAVAVPASRACGWCRTRCHGPVPGGLREWGKPLGPNGPARFATVSRCASPAGERSANILSTCSRNPGNSAASGIAAANNAGVSSRRLRSPQTPHRSMCRLIRLRISTVICPSQPARIMRRSGQAVRPVRATISAPRDRSSWLRARDSCAWAWLRDTPSASASSSPSSSATRLNSMTSRSPGFSPSIAALTSSASSARSVATPTSAVWLGRSPASSRADRAFPARSRRRHSLRATAYSQARSFPGSRRLWSLAAATRNVSCTASAASAGSRSIERQYE